jgi:hypothetical protein
MAPFLDKPDTHPASRRHQKHHALTRLRKTNEDTTLATAAELEISNREKQRGCVEALFIRRFLHPHVITRKRLLLHPQKQWLFSMN